MVTARLIRAMSEHRKNITGSQENPDSDTGIFGLQEEGYNPDETPKFSVIPNPVTIPIQEKILCVNTGQYFSIAELNEN